MLYLTLPAGRIKKVKDYIVYILCFEYPLSSMQIYRKIKKEGKISCTYQAIHKALNELCDSEVLLKKVNTYCIDMNWIKKIKKFANNIEKNYSYKKNLPLVDGVIEAREHEDITVLTFDSIIDMDKTWINIKKDYYKKARKNDVIFWEGNHCWWLLAYPELEYGLIDELNKYQIRDFHIIHNNTFLDKWSKKFYDKTKIKCKIDKTPIREDITVFGDTIMQVIWPKNLLDDLDNIYKKHKNVKDVDMHSLLKNILTKKTKIQLKIIKNKTIADQLKKKVLNEFNEKV